MFRREKMSIDCYKLVWHLLHFIFDIVDVCCWCIAIIAVKSRNVLKQWRNEDNFSHDKRLIEANKKYLTKIPSHLAVILGVELPDFKALSNIIFWCLSAGIKDISFYDYQGILVENNNKIYDYLSQWKKENDKIFWNLNTRGICGSQIVYKNGLKKDISVNFLSPGEGKPKIAEICRQIANDASLAPEQININTVNEKFSKIINSDPELAIYFGDVCSTYGFLPWHIRLTEFMQIKSQKTLSVEMFLTTLFKYSKVEQRFGF